MIKLTGNNHITSQVGNASKPDPVGSTSLRLPVESVIEPVVVVAMKRR